MKSAISFRPSDGIVTLLEAFTKKKHLTKTQVINQALIEYLHATDAKIKKQVAILRAIDKDDDYISGDL